MIIVHELLCPLAVPIFSDSQSVVVFPKPIGLGSRRASNSSLALRTSFPHVRDRGGGMTTERGKQGSGKAARDGDGLVDLAPPGNVDVRADQ